MDTSNVANGRWGRLPSDLTEGPVGKATIRRVNVLEVPPDSDAEVVAAMAVQLARVIDQATMRGQAASVSNAARELREAMDRLTSELRPQDHESDADRAARLIAEAFAQPDGAACGDTPSIFGEVQ